MSKISTKKTLSKIPQVVSEVLTERFEHIYGRFVLHRDESVATPYSVDCLALSAAFRSNILQLVESLHSDVRLRLSTCVRVNQLLPDDILIHIMSTMSLKELVNATHVCHRWRKLGIETPALWTRLDLAGAFLVNAKELFARSKTMPLNITISVAPSYVRRLRRLSYLVRSHIRRARVLSIIDSSESVLRRDWQPGVLRNHIRVPGEPLLPAPMLTTLRIDATSSLLTEYFYDVIAGRFDFSALQEAYLLRGPRNIKLLRPCTQLRVLVLSIPATISGMDVLRLLRGNPPLRDVELRIPPGWKGYLPNPPLLSAPEEAYDRALFNGAPLVCSLERLAVLTESADRLDVLPPFDPTANNFGLQNTSLLPATAYFVDRLDCSAIPLVDVACSLESFEEPLGSALLGHLQGITTVQLAHEALLLQDSRGYTRRFSRLDGAQGPFDLARPFLTLWHVRVLGLSLEEWHRLNQWHGITELTYLEGLTLTALLQNFATMERGIACPALRSLTLTVMSHCVALPTKDEVLSVGKDIVLHCLEMCPPLQSLIIVREIDHGHVEDETLHFAAPLPLTVFLTSAVVDDLPRLLSPLDSEYDEDSAWALGSDSESGSEVSL